jgi:hypothetical protein
MSHRSWVTVPKPTFRLFRNPTGGIGLIGKYPDLFDLAAGPSCRDYPSNAWAVFLQGHKQRPGIIHQTNVRSRRVDCQWTKPAIHKLTHYSLPLEQNEN